MSLDTSWVQELQINVEAPEQYKHCSDLYDTMEWAGTGLLVKGLYCHFNYKLNIMFKGTLNHFERFFKIPFCFAGLREANFSQCFCVIISNISVLTVDCLFCM